jgi:hypothetical protein
MIDLVLLVLALVCFVLAAAGVPSRVQFVPLGLALWVLSALVP